MVQISQVSTLRSAIIPRTSAASQISLMLTGTVFLTLMAQISFPIPGSPVPFTGQTLGVLLLGTAFGALFGALIVGLVINLSTLFIDVELKNMMALLVLVVVLMFKPQGLFGRKERIG